MGKGGGGALAFAGAVLSIAGFPYIGIPLAMIGGIIAQQAMKKEAMARMKAAMTGMRANTRTTERPIPVIYGRHRVGGNVLWMSTEGKGPNDASPPRNKLFVVYGLSEGPIDGYEEMFFNDVKVWDASSGQLRTQFYNAFYSEFRTGTNSQAPFSHVATYHNMYDIASETFPLTAVALVEFFYNSDIYQAIPNVTWTVRGKQIPDWTDASSPGIMKWTQSGPLQVADLLTNKQYGMGISSANLSVSDLTSAHAYATAPISPGSRETIEIVDMSAQRPKYYERTVQVPAVGVAEGNDDNPWTPSSLHDFTLSDKIPIKPGSLSFISNLGSAYYDSPRSGMISEFGRILGAGAAQVGSVNYLSGVMAVNRPPVYSDAYEVNHTVFDWKGRWYADWEFSYRTKYQNAARSMYVVSTPETLVETGTVASNIINLYSTQGGAGTFNYGTGALNAYFGAHEWYENQPVEIHYRVSTRARFSTNYPLFEPEKVMDAIKNIQNHYRGFLVYADGQYGIKVDKPEGSVYSFDDDNIVAGTFRLHQPSIKEIPTKITLKYLDALNNYTPAEASFDVRSVDPGMEIEHVLDMPGTTIRDEGMATAYSYANLANLVNYIEFETNHNAIGVEAGDVVDVTHPAAAWTQKLFRVLGISFAKDDKLAISAIEHDPSAYVDDWIQGPMVSRNPSFFPRQSYWPPNVSSATLTEYSRTLSDGTVVPSIKYQIMAVDSANLHVDHWNVYYTNLIRGQQMRLGFSGVNTTGYLSPVEPGWNIVNIHAVSQFGNESAKVWTGSVNVQGMSEFEWQTLRVRKIDHYENTFNLYHPAIIDLAGIRYAAGVDGATGTKVWLHRLSGGTPLISMEVGSVITGIDNLMEIVPNSGGCISVFWHYYATNNNPVWGATYEPTSLICVASPYRVTSVMEASSKYPMYGGTFAANSAGQIYWFGYSYHGSGNGTTAQNRHIRYCAVSCNLNPSSSTYLFDTDSYTLDPEAVGLSAFFPQSLGALVYGGISSGSNPKIWTWTFDHDVSSFYTSAVEIGSLGTKMTTMSVKANAFYPETTIIMVSAIPGGADFDPAYGLYYTIIDIRSPAATAPRWGWSGEDLKTMQPTYWYGTWLSKPMVTIDTFGTHVLAQATFTSTPYVDLDIYRYWRVTSMTPYNAMTWNWA